MHASKQARKTLEPLQFSEQFSQLRYNVQKQTLYIRLVSNLLLHSQLKMIFGKSFNTKPNLPYSFIDFALTNLKPNTDSFSANLLRQQHI